MNNHIKLTKEEARHFILGHQRLLPPRLLESDRDILDFIRQAGCIQYDPLNRTARNADLVLQSRVQNYKEETLSRLLYEERSLMDGWDKMMSIWPVEDWSCFERKRGDFRKEYAKRHDMDEACREIREYLSIYDYISSGDIKSPRQVGWYWAPATVVRAALESLYHSGELVIHHKEGTRKHYGLAEKVLPGHIISAPDPNGSEKDYHDWYVLRRLSSQGLYWNKSSDGAWLGCPMNKEYRTQSLTRLLGKDRIREVSIEGMDTPFYIRREDIPALKQTRGDSDHSQGGASFIAPLDNLIWDRQLIRELFGFDYKWEVYTPAKERKYAYYVLPVLWRERFIARFEPVLDRKNGILRIEDWWWEEGEGLTSEIREDLSTALTAFTSFLGARKIRVSTKRKLNGLRWMKEIL